MVDFLNDFGIMDVTNCRFTSNLFSKYNIAIQGGNDMNIETIGERIAKKRKEVGLTQNKLAEKLIISNKAVSKWESGLSSPSIDLLPNLADILNCSIDYLVRGNREEDYSINEEISIKIDELRNKILEDIEKQVSAVAYDVWISSLKFSQLKNNVLYLLTQSESSKSVIDKKYRKTIIDVAKKYYQPLETVVIDLEK